LAVNNRNEHIEPYKYAMAINWYGYMSLRRAGIALYEEQYGFCGGHILVENLLSLIKAHQ
jgi:hypothetical protein